MDMGLDICFRADLARILAGAEVASQATGSAVGLTGGRRPCSEVESWWGQKGLAWDRGGGR
jgi:hypothetical protein